MSNFTEKLKNIGKDISNLASETTDEITGKIKELGKDVPGQVSETTGEIAEKTKSFGKSLFGKGKAFFEAGVKAVKDETPSKPEPIVPPVVPIETAVNSDNLQTEEDKK